MTPSELKRNVEATGSAFFDYRTMRFFGDTMKNFGVRKVTIATPSVDALEVYELYRKRPVKMGLEGSSFFDTKTFQRAYRIAGVAR
jgi:hypothetical protein